MPHEGKLLDLLAETVGSFCHFFLRHSGYRHVDSHSSRFSGDDSTQKVSKRGEPSVRRRREGHLLEEVALGFDQGWYLHAICASTSHLIQPIGAHTYTELRILLKPRAITNRSNWQIRGYLLAIPEPGIDWGEIWEAAWCNDKILTSKVRQT